MTQFKPLSVSDFEGLTCEARHVAERYLSYRVESPAMEYGIQVHELARQINVKRKDRDFEVTPEVIREMVAASPLAWDRKVSAEIALKWWAERTHGSRPVDVERLREVEIAGRRWVFKPDAVLLNDRGELRIHDYKTGFTGDHETARRNPRFMFYAAFGAEFYQSGEVHVDVWNLGMEFALDLTWDAEELDAIRAHLRPAAEKIAALHERLQGNPPDKWEELLQAGAFAERFNDYCGSCPLGKLGKCATLKRFLLHGALPEATDDAHRLELLRTARRVASSMLRDMEPVLKAHVIELGQRTHQTKKDGTPVGYHVLRFGPREVIVKVEHHRLGEFKEKAELLRDVLAKGKRSEMKARGKKWAVRTLEIGDGLIVTHKVDAKKEKSAQREKRERLVQKLVVREAGPCDDLESERGTTITSGRVGSPEKQQDSEEIPPYAPPGSSVEA